MNTKKIKPCTTNLCEVCKQIYDKKEDGVNSLQTLNPYGTHKRHCAKLNGSDDADAKAESKNRYIIKEKISILKDFSKSISILNNI